MRLLPAVDLSRPSRTAAGAGLLLAMLLALPRPAAAQRDTDRIDITGRQNLTLGSGARAYGMGGAFVARADDATAASWNPAGLSYLRQPEVSLVGAFNSFDTTRGLENDRFRGNAIDFAALTWPVALGSIRGAVQVSYQRAISFDGQRKIDIYEKPEEEDPRLGVLTRTWRGGSDGGFDVLAFGTGFQLSRQLRAGVTVNRWSNGYTQQLTQTWLKADQPRPIRQFDLEFRPSGYSMNFGLIYSPVEAVNIAAVYKTPFTASVEMDRSRIDHWSLNDVIPPAMMSHSSDGVRLRLPSSFGFGVSWRPSDPLTLSADYTRTGWADSKITDHFDLVVGQPITVNRPAQYPTLYPADGKGAESGTYPQRDAEQVRVGAEYVLFAGRVKVPLRAGYFLDRQIKPNPDGRAPRYNGVTAGLGLVLGPMLLDVAYVHESGEYQVSADQAGGIGAGGSITNAVGGGDSGSSAPLRYGVSANRVFASVIYRFKTP